MKLTEAVWKSIKYHHLPYVDPAGNDAEDLDNIEFKMYKKVGSSPFMGYTFSCDEVLGFLYQEWEEHCADGDMLTQEGIDRVLG